MTKSMLPSPVTPNHRWLSQAAALVLLLSLLLTACGTAVPAPIAAPTKPPAPKVETARPALPTATSAPTVTAAPTATATALPTALVVAAPTTQPVEMVLAVATSVANSGLFDALLPEFEKQNNVHVWVVGTSSSKALQMGLDGNADLLLVHSPTAEKDFMAKGAGVRREEVLVDDFVVVGPAADPANVGQRKTGVSAFMAIAGAQAPFVSLGTTPTVSVQEGNMWAAAGLEPKDAWYITGGQGMPAVLALADQKQAYTLSDRASYVAMVQKGLKLKILVEGDKDLINHYNLIVVNPAKSTKVKSDLANLFVDWLTSVPTQEKIAAYKKVDYGMSVLMPSSNLWRAAHP
jgi:tungstate transport system substrate-binding protein